MNGAFARVIKSIVMILGIYLIIVNIISWFNSPDVIDYQFTYNWSTNYRGWHTYQMSEYKGFSWFYEKLSTFPGLTNTRQILDDLGKLVNPVSSEGWPSDALGWIQTFFMTILSPIAVLITLIIDIISNAIWFFGFLWF